MTAAFSMLEVPKLPPKPRKKSMLLMSEVGMPLRATEDMLEVAASIIDYAKITDHSGLVDHLSADWVRKKIALYNKHGVDVVPGGIPYQLAVVQHQVDAYFKQVKDLGFAGVEMSEDTMAPLKKKVREDHIAQAQGMGLKVMTEMGRKNVDVPFNADEICEQILRDIELGVSKIYLESSEIQEITQSDPRALDQIAALGKNEYLLFELGMIEPQEKAAWLVERYGPDINFASVSPVDVIAVDAIRRGMHRKAHYRYLANRHA